LTFKYAISEKLCFIQATKPQLLHCSLDREAMSISEENPTNLQAQQIDMSTKRVLVTGASGYIAQHLVYQLLQR
jgi:FlaA1/EpsC-like NDP-sugar epimerase